MLFRFIQKEHCFKKKYLFKESNFSMPCFQLTPYKIRCPITKSLEFLNKVKMKTICFENNMLNNSRDYCLTKIQI